MTNLDIKNGKSFEAESEYLYQRKIEELQERIRQLEAILEELGVEDK